MGLPVGRLVFDADWRIREADDGAAALLRRGNLTGLSRPATVASHYALPQSPDPPARLPCSRYRVWRLGDGTTRSFLLHFYAHPAGVALEFEPADWSLGFADQLHEALAVADEQGIVVHANLGLLDLLDVPPEHIVGRSVESIARRLALVPHRSDALLQGATPHHQVSGRFQARRPDGRPFVLEVRSSPWRYRGLVCGTIWTAADITEHEEWRWQAAAAVWYHVSTTVQHRLRNPLQTVQAAVEHLRGLEPLSAQPYLDLIERQLRMVNDALPGRMRPSDRAEAAECRLSDLVDQQIQFSALRLATRRLRFRHEVPSWEPTVRVQAGPMGRAVAHLFHNSAQARRDARIHIDYARCDGALTCRMTDDGPGFEGPPYGGWLHPEDGEAPRLGLAMVVSTIEAHGGTVSFGNDPRGGARIWLRIPSAHAACAQHLQPSQEPDLRPSQRANAVL
jgi:PAS domain S-box-containing protein